MTIDARPPSALTIAGSDSGGGAGVQADLKTFAAHGVHGLSAFAALTAQHTRGVTGVHVPPLDFLQAQVDACFDDFRVGVVKLGMLATPEVIHAVADLLERHSPLHVVLDPVMVATSGAKLLQDNALDALRQRLMPLASVITPNLPEAELLLGRRIDSLATMQEATGELLALGSRSVYLKGGHLEEGDEVVDLFGQGQTRQQTRHPRLPLQAHGTGCTLASAIAANLCLDMPLDQACLAASDYVHRALERGYRPGRSDVVVLNHFAAGAAS